MIKAMASELISETIFVLGASIPFNKAQDISEILLSRCLAEGMLPPYRDIIIEGHLCDDNTWEPEESP